MQIYGGIAHQVMDAVPMYKQISVVFAQTISRLYFPCKMLLFLVASLWSSDMPQSYIFRMVAMDFGRVVSEAPMDIDSDIKGGLTPEECQRLTRVKSSLHKYSEFQDSLPQDEMDEKIQEEERRTQVNKYSLYSKL